MNTHTTELILDYSLPKFHPVCLLQGFAVQELTGLPGEDGAQRRFLGTVQGLHPLLAAHGALVPYLLAHL